ncbi:inosine/xanthosine triphosphatase [Ferrimonas sediminum]|uniref:inosine/xanthosine triphosphatase n=1 Tax=Ferrimonas sediminum TaxID=718193 RepID=A0A1G8KM46_9GAMM|nr:inosine/xanthosine triphosphatase [Ferrimonas sediminum]SDI44521.1 inosine/xanthosine triphosphatase [Ferrimonas sediminum]
MTQIVQKTLIVASRNPVKVNAATRALQAAYPDCHWRVQGVSVPSGVDEQPLGETETRVGAINRLNAIKAMAGDLYVSFEGGYDRIHGQGFTFAYVAISDGQHTQIGRTGLLPLPEVISQRLEQGEELGPLMDELFDDHNIRQKGGAMGILTNNLVDRTSVYSDTLCMLLAPFLHPELFQATASAKPDSAATPSG